MRFAGLESLRTLPGSCGTLMMRDKTYLCLLQKFCVTLTVFSRFKTACHHPLGINTMSPGFCTHSKGRLLFYNQNKQKWVNVVRTRQRTFPLALAAAQLEGRHAGNEVELDFSHPRSLRVSLSGRDEDAQQETFKSGMAKCAHHSNLLYFLRECECTRKINFYED